MSLDKPTILFVSSYLPRECGIATFTHDTLNAINASFTDNFDLRVAALQEHAGVEREYGQEVITTVEKSNEGYRQLARFINSSPQIRLVVLEHEFGLYAGEYGEDVLNLVTALKKPFFVVLHTVLSTPKEKMARVLKQLVMLSDWSIVMTAHAKRLLIQKYGIPDRKVTIIPHGYHLKYNASKEDLKAKYGCSGKVVLSTFGLLSRNKGVEVALDALSKVKNQDYLIYLILGKTHPEVKKHEGESYRGYLEEKTQSYGLDNHVRFVNRFLELDELLEYLHMTDIYLFTSKDPEQAISGTLTYALGAGCAVLTTPISQAGEILEQNAAMSFQFDKSDDLAEKIELLIKDKNLRRELSYRAISNSRKGLWQNVILSYADLFAKALKFDKRLIFNKPKINLSHLKIMTNDIGLFQFSDLEHPNPLHGFTLDDNARALYVLINYKELYPEDHNSDHLMETYLNFITKCVMDDGGFLNYLDEYGEFTNQNYFVNTDEAASRAFLALAQAVNSMATPVSIRTTADALIQKVLPYIENISSPRGIGKILKGLYLLSQVKEDDSELMELVEEKANYLCTLFELNNTDNWQWYEPRLSYSNSDIPEGLFYAYLCTQKAQYKTTALASLEFLLEIMVTKDMVMPVSHRSQIAKDDDTKIDLYGQQPVEVASLVECVAVAYHITQDERYRELVNLSFTWFLGNNLLRQIVYSPATGGGHDGLEVHGVNLNQGAESSLSYLISLLTVEKIYRQPKTAPDLDLVQ